MSYKNKDIKVIKYSTMGKIKYDWYNTLKPEAGYMSYTKKTIYGTKTNYIHGDFETMSHEKYHKVEKK